MKKTIFFILLFLFSILYAYNFKLNFENYTTTKLKNYDVIELSNSFYYDLPGKPMLPIIPIKIIVPLHKVVDNIKINAESNILKNKFHIPPTPENLPLITQPNNTLKKSKDYFKNNYYPENNYQIKGIFYKNGVAILIINLFPFRYNSVTKKILHNKNFNINISFKSNKKNNNLKTYKILKPKFLIRSLKKDNYYNLDAIKTYFNKNNKNYTTKSSLVSSDSPFDYIIITNNQLYPYFNNLIAHKQSLGYLAAIFKTEDIYSNYTGRDNAEKIRNFIIDAYNTWSSTDHPLQWVLLGGDSNIIPSRLVKVYAYWSSNWNVRSFYTDNYFAGLDGNWDNDNDSIFGEGDDNSKPEDFTYELGTAGEEADWLFEIAVGRASLEDSTEVNNWINKTISYENLNTIDYLRTSTLVGEYLGGGAWGADCMNQIALYQPQYDINKLYQKDGNFSKENVIEAINNGTNFISHIGHGSYLKVCNIYDGDVDTLLTNTNYCLFYTQACYTGLFHNLDCIAESFIEKPHGAYAFIGNTHYGFYSTFEQQGSSQLYQREFYNSIENENIKRLGNALNNSKEELVGMIGATGTMRFSGFDITLFGDPNLQLITNVQNVNAIQLTENQIKVTYCDSLPEGANNISNYLIYKRDDNSETINISSISSSNNEIFLNLSENLEKGIPYEIKISDVNGLKNPTKRPIQSIYNIIELSINKPTVWTNENSPYYIYKNLVINGGNLTIQPGTVIKFYNDKFAIVYNNGWIKAIGNHENKIIFTSYTDSSRAEKGDWDQIIIYRDSKSDSCIFENCIIQYATIGINIDSLTTPKISNTIIKNCAEKGIYSYFASPEISNVGITNCSNGFYFENSQLSIKNIVSYENENYGIYLINNSTINLQNSIIRSNTNGDIFNNNSSITISYCDLQTVYPGEGNITLSPLFEDTSEFSLSQFSPCIDAGNPDDLDPDGTIADMGIKYYEQLSNLSSPPINYITISDSVLINWQEVDGAIFYNIYSSDNPFDSFILKKEHLKSLTWKDSISTNKKFYIIKAANNRN